MDFDITQFTNQPFVKKNSKPWGYELIFTDENLPYCGKILHLESGKRISLQYHDKKRETQMLVGGECKLIIDDDKKELQEINMELLKGYNILPGQRHRLAAIKDSNIYEVSTPEIGTTYRLEDDYARPDETEKRRAQERKDI